MLRLLLGIMLVYNRGSCKLTWASRFFFSDRVLSGRWPGDEKIKKNVGKFGIRRSCISCVLCQASLLRSPASYILFSGVRNGTKSAEAAVQWDEVNRKLIRRCRTRAHRVSQKHCSPSTQRPWRLIPTAPHCGKSWVLRI